MSLNVLEHKLETMHVSLHSFIEKESNWIAIFFHILTINIITYVLQNNINFQYYKTSNFVELMLELWIFLINKDDCIKFF